MRGGVARDAGSIDYSRDSVKSRRRVELGLARSLGGEWDTFEVDGESTRDQLVEALHMIPHFDR